MDHDPALAVKLISIKSQPESWSKETLNAMVDIEERTLDSSYERTGIKSKFNEDVANEILYKAYYPILQRYPLNILI